MNAFSWIMVLLLGTSTGGAVWAARKGLMLKNTMQSAGQPSARAGSVGARGPRGGKR